VLHAKLRNTTCQGLDQQGQGPSLQGPVQGQGLDLQGQGLDAQGPGQGQGLISPSYILSRKVEVNCQRKICD